jgi:hypothetical protein
MEKMDTWTITAHFTVFAGDMSKAEVIKTAADLLEKLTDGTDFMGADVIDAKRDE